MALATVADVVPLHDENRAFVREGLAQLSRGARCGIRALKQVAGMTRDVQSETIAFKFGAAHQCRRAIGRCDVGCAVADDGIRTEAQRLADRLEQLNRERQRIEVDIMAEALASLKDPRICRRTCPGLPAVASRGGGYRGGALGRTVSPPGDCHGHR